MTMAATDIIFQAYNTTITTLNAEPASEIIGHLSIQEVVSFFLILIIAFILGCSIAFALILLGYPDIASMMPFNLGQYVGGISPYRHFISLYRGVLDLSDIVYYLSAIVFFLFLNIRSVESRKWA